MAKLIPYRLSLSMAGGPYRELTTQNILSGALSKTRFPIPLDPLEVISRYLHRLTVLLMYVFHPLYVSVVYK